MNDKPKAGPIKGARVVQTIMLDEWQIWTGIYRDKRGWASARNRYPIPKETIQQIAYDFLIKELGELTVPTLKGPKKYHHFKSQLALPQYILHILFLGVYSKVDIQERVIPFL